MAVHVQYRTHIGVWAVALLLTLFVLGAADVYAGTATTSVSVITVECNDGLDNDSDGLIDFPNDPGCTGFDDDDETDPECRDGLDNDGDGLVDYPTDPGCDSLNDNDETDAPAPPSDDAGGVSGGRSGRVLPPIASRVIFSGLAHPYGTVVLLKDGVHAAEVIAAADASFTITLSDVTAGTYLFTLYGTDTDGIRSGILLFTTEITSGFRTDITSVFVPPTIQLLDREITETTRVAGQTAPAASVTVVGFAGGVEAVEIQVTAGEDGVYGGSLAGAALLAADTAIKSFAITDGFESPFGRAAGFLLTPDQRVLRGDFNNDRRVNLVDFSIAAFWFKRADPPTQFDLNQDSVVDLVDLSIMAFYWTG